MNQQTQIFHSVPDSLFRKLMSMAEGYDGMKSEIHHMKEMLCTQLNGGVEKISYSLKEAELATGISRSSLTLAFKEGKIKGMQEGHNKPIYLYKKSLEDFLFQRKDKNLQVVNKAS